MYLYSYSLSSMKYSIMNLNFTTKFVCAMFYDTIRKHFLKHTGSMIAFRVKNLKEKYSQSCLNPYSLKLFFLSIHPLLQRFFKLNSFLVPDFYFFLDRFISNVDYFCFQARRLLRSRWLKNE